MIALTGAAENRRDGEANEDQTGDVTHRNQTLPKEAPSHGMS